MRARTDAADGEFARRLRALGLRAQRREPWLMVGKPSHVAGWKLHVSVTAKSIDLLFDHVLPCLARRGAHFKMAADRNAIVQLCAGNFGEAQVGKVLTVYPRNDAEAVVLARELIEQTRGIPGPRIATDLHLGEAVYARYGSVRPRMHHDRLGEPSELIPDGTGNWVPDLRPIPFTCPQGIAIPFQAAVLPGITSRQGVRRLLAGRYFVTDVLRPGFAGSILRAIDLAEGGKPRACVLKQGRPHCFADELGRDRRARLRHEGRVLALLRGLTGVASAGEYFEDEAIGYLPIAYVPGRSLAEFVFKSVSGRSWLHLRPQVRQVLLRYATQLVRRLRSAHARGVIHRDVAPGNVWIGDDGHVYLLDWEGAHVTGSRIATFRLGTPSFSELSHERRAPVRRDDWQACGRVITFMLTGLDPAAVLHGGPQELAARLDELTGLQGGTLIELLSGALADQPSVELDGRTLLSALNRTEHAAAVRRRRSDAPLFMATSYELVLQRGFELLAGNLRLQLDRLRVQRRGREAQMLDAHSGVAGLLYVLAEAHRAQVAHLDAALAARAGRILTAHVPVVPDLPGLVHGSAGRALAVAAAVQAGCVSGHEALRAGVGSALAGHLDWPDFTHGAAGQGFAALGCAQRLDVRELSAGASACAAYLVRTQDADGAWTLPEGAPGASGERFTGFAHGAAGMMAFLATYAARTGDAAADTAWRRAERWLLSRARQGRGGRWRWPQSDSRQAPSNWWCHGAPGIALGWLCVAQSQGIAAVPGEYLRGALGTPAEKMRSDSLGQCHGLAGLGEVYLEAHRLLHEQCWRERATEIANVLLALFRRRSGQPWHYMSEEAAAGSGGLMLGTAGILHFLLRHRHSTVITRAPLLA